MSNRPVNPSYWDVDPAVGTLYVIELLMTSRRELYFYFPNTADRDAVYEQLLTAISPALVIESNGSIAPKLPEQKWSRFKKPIFPNDVFATEEEYDRAAFSVMQDLESGRSLPRPPAPSEKPPRKPYTRKPRE